MTCDNEKQHRVQPVTTFAVDPVAPENQARQLAEFSVTSDSVVATAQLVYEDGHEFVSIAWGDGTTSDIDLRRERLAIDPDLPPNTLRLQHVYSPDYKAGQSLVVAITRDRQGRKSLDADVVRIRPRYRFVHYPLVIEFNDHLDTALETHSEVDIFVTMKRDEEKILSRHWHVQEHTSGGLTGDVPAWPPRHFLKDSFFSFEMDPSKGAILYDLEIYEDDGGWGSIKSIFGGLKRLLEGFDTNAEILDFIHPDVFTGHREHAVRYDLRDGKVTVYFSMELSLIVPLDRGPGNVVAARG